MTTLLLTSLTLHGRWKSYKRQMSLAASIGLTHSEPQQQILFQFKIKNVLMPYVGNINAPIGTSRRNMMTKNIITKSTPLVYSWIIKETTDEK
ncbi:hypothetical protein MJ560_19020 [Klebsiella pneumoniae]|nr:hypothetical protein MJ560_19020 [Klebsiella pneumoniae]